MTIFFSWCIIFGIQVIYLWNGFVIQPTIISLISIFIIYCLNLKFTPSWFHAPSLLQLKSFTTFLTELSFESIVLIMLFPAPKILKASLCLPDKIWSPYMVFKTLYNAAPVSLFCLPFSTIPQALAILCYLLIPKHAHSSPPEPLHIMFSCLNVLPFITCRKKSYFSFSFSSEKFPSLWRPVTTNIQIISLFFVFQEHYHAMSTPLIVLK